MAAKRLYVTDEHGLSCCSVPKLRKCTIDRCVLPAGHIHDAFNSERTYLCLGALTPLLDQNFKHSFMKINPVKVVNTNADDGTSFSDAYCEVEFYPEAYPIAVIFQRGLQILLNYLIDKQIPENEVEAYSLEVLLHFLDQKYFTEEVSSLESLKEKSETDITVFLANHFFEELSLTSKYVIGGQSKEKRKGNACSCSKEGCKMTGIFGDTTIGNAEVWHGKVDVLLNSTDMILKIDGEEETDDHGNSPKKSAVERKRHKSSSHQNDRMFAETIVFSFLQKQLHPYRRHHLYPYIAVNCKGLFVYFYDSEHDILLRSSLVPLFDRETRNFNFSAIILSWLVVNHKCLCNGLSTTMACKKSGFFMCKKIDIFQVDLHCGQVEAQIKSHRNLNPVKEFYKEVEDLNKRRLHAMADKSFE